MAHVKTGFHSGIGGNRTGIGEYFRRLDAAGIPFVVKSVNDGGLAAEAAGFTNADHTIIYRDTTPAGRGDDLPDYDKPPEDEGPRHWGRVLGDMPPEVAAVKELVWIETGNEFDKAQSDWMGQFAYHYCRAANADGYRVIPFSCNYGEPEREHWRTPGMRRFLAYASENTAKVCVGLHEGKLGDIDASPEEFYPHIVGRLEWLFEECDEMGIGHPTVAITESQWAYDDMPALETAMRDVRWYAEYYAQHPEVIGQCLWTLHGGSEWKDLPNKLQGLIKPITDYALVTTFPDPDPEPDPEPPPVEQFVWNASLERDTINEDAALQRAIFQAGYVPYSTEFWREHSSGDVYAIQSAFDWPTRTRAVSYARVPEWGNVQVILEPSGQQPDDVFSSPVGTAEERAGGIIWPGAWVDANPFLNLYTLNGRQVYHTGADLNLNTPLWNADKDAPVYAAADGVVIFAQRVPSPSTWGRLVVIRHGERLHTRYAHMATMLVQQGQTVKRGEPIGTIGGAEFGLADHLHFDVCHSGILEADPRHWPGTSQQGVIDNYLPPLDFLLEHGGIPEPPKDTLDLLPYLMGVQGHSHEMQYSLGGKTGTHPLQMHHDGQSFYIVKGWNGEYESLYYDDGYIYRDIDTSEAPNRFYVQRTIEGGKEYDGHPWAARRMAVGDTFHRQPRVLHFWQDTCNVRTQGDPASTLTLLAHHDTLTFSQTGISVKDVIVLSWSGGERYYFARGESLVGFEVGSGWSYVSERHNRSLSRNLPPCYVAKARYWR